MALLKLNLTKLQENAIAQAKQRAEKALLNGSDFDCIYTLIDYLRLEGNAMDLAGAALVWANMQASGEA